MKQHGIDIQLDIEGSTLSDFSVTEFKLHEKLHEPFTLTVSLVSSSPSHTADAFLLKKASLYLYTNGLRQRRIEGVIACFERGQRGVHKTYYTLTIRPSVWLLSLRQNSRIFLKQRVTDIINTLFDEHHLAYDSRLEETHLMREYTVQKRETDLDFVLRLAAEEGISLWTHNLNGEAEQTFYSDTWMGLTGCCAISYNVHPQNNSKGNYLHALTFTSSLTPGQAIIKDNHYKNPDYPFKSKCTPQQTASMPELYSHYDSYARFHALDEGHTATFARYRIEQLQNTKELGNAKSNCIKIRVGAYTTITDHPDSNMNDNWQIIEVTHHGRLPQNAQEDFDGTGAYITNEFTFIPGTKTYRPPYRPKPTADGAETAIVCGPEGEEIHVNEQGQVLVRFHWDKNEKTKHHASCWVRVAQGWNGGRYGFYAIPRIGQEIIISYLNNDIDRPIITGCVYNEKHKPPLQLPEQKTRTTFRTQTHKGKGHNELLFDDDNGKELIHVHAQKDIDIKVLNSKNECVEYDRTTSVGHDEKLVVANNRIVTIEQQQDITVKANDIEKIEADKSLTVAGDLAQKVDGTFSVSSAGGTVIKSDDKITLQVGSNFIVIHSGGININGNDVTAGPSFRVSAEGTPNALVLPNAPAVLKAAAGKGTMFVAHCPMILPEIVSEDEEFTYSYYAENDDGEPVELNYRFDSEDGQKIHEAMLNAGRTISLPMEQSTNVRFWLNDIADTKKATHVGSGEY